MDELLLYINNEVYSKCSLKISDFQQELEGKEYKASTFKLNDFQIISRNSKITPKKVGQFVTCWKRDVNGETSPFFGKDDFDFLIINAKKDNCLGQFVFPKSVLITKGIVISENKKGKRGFRVYPSWDIATNSQAKKTQLWQLRYFYELDNVDIKKVTQLYQK